MNRYPRRATVLMNCGLPASSPSAWRSSETACVKCVVGDVGVRPERVEQLLFRDQLAGVVEQMEQEVEELGRQLDDGVVSQDAIASAIGKERTELVAGACHAP